MKSIFSTKTKEKVIEDEDVDLSKLFTLIVHNDDINTFENVIYTLMEVCAHTEEQAMQCALIIHNNGKCSVKEGDYDTLRIMCEKIVSRGLTATVELN